jgi:hypothetical protein
VLRLVGLQQAKAAALLAPGAAYHLMEQLERALDGARVAVGQAEIGVDDADQIELGDSAVKARFKQYFVSPIFFYA